jgi:hypothetical protein
MLINHKEMLKLGLEFNSRWQRQAFPPYTQTLIPHGARSLKVRFAQ